jgi:host factor-I protein
MNRKLIRPNLSQPRGKERDDMSERDYYRDKSQSYSRQPYNNDSDSIGRKKTAPIAETNAEIFYYKKQIDSHTEMVLVLQDGEEVKGTIEWYDRDALKINRKNAPNLLLLKHNIKYMFKADDKK